MRVHPMLEREPLRAEERARQAARPDDELDGLKLLDLEDATVEIAVRIGLTTASRRLRSATRK